VIGASQKLKCPWWGILYRILWLSHIYTSRSSPGELQNRIVFHYQMKRTLQIHCLACVQTVSPTRQLLDSFCLNQLGSQYLIWAKKKEKAKKKSLPRGIEPRSPALIGFNDKRKSSPLDQGRCRWSSYCSATWLVDERGGCLCIDSSSTEHPSLYSDLPGHSIYMEWTRYHCPFHLIITLWFSQKITKARSYISRD
jgi:hypothetical protein